MVEQTQVIICGAGPTGALLSAMLAKLRVPNIILEREKDVTTDPRGIALDEDGIRALQAIGIYDKVFTQIASAMLRFNFISGVHSDFYKTPVASMDISTSEGATGHVGVICHKQPEMEKAIRSTFADNPYSLLRSGCSVIDISEDDQNVTVQYTNADGDACSVQGKFLVGADGKTGYVRKKYLEPRGITLEHCNGTNYDETWVALNWKITPPTKETHPDFPLWERGYTPEDVYDSFFPREFRFLCNPLRPAVCGRFGLQTDRLWRFEFVVHKEEDGMHMATKEEVNKIIFPYLTHAGNRYGLSNSVQFPEDCIETLRSRPFRFQARSCNKWALGRVVLAGDAAHVFPPFGGQGIASGFRDACSLAWRLALLHREPAADHIGTFRAWYVERKQQLDESLSFTLKNGALVNESNPIKLFIRDWLLWLIQLVPSWKRQIEKGPRSSGSTCYKHEPGLPFLPAHGGGCLLPQVYIWKLAENRAGFSDDMLFSAEKHGLFQLLLCPNDIEEASALVSAVKKVRDNRFVSVDEATVIVQNDQLCPSTDSPTDDNMRKFARLATAEEFAEDPILCCNRPVPKYYDPFRLKRDIRSAKIVVVRPDRFVYAACQDPTELAAVLKGMEGILLNAARANAKL